VRLGRPRWQVRLDSLPARALPGGMTVHEAQGFTARLQGLGGLPDLPPNRGLMIRTRAVHTLTMRFPLDLVWLGRGGEVLRVDRAVPPRRQRSCRRARAVVELRAGAADAFLTAARDGYTALR
jgi:uncharacterized protein